MAGGIEKPPRKQRFRNMKQIAVQNSIGMVLAHDVTLIIPGRFKGPAFKRGHVIQEADIGRLLDMGKEHIAVLDLQPGWVHEDEAALRLANAAAGQGIKLSEPSEGKVDLFAGFGGLLKINVAGLKALNAIPNLIMATLHTGRLVEPGEKIAGTRIIPLTIEEAALQAAETACGEHGPIALIKPLQARTVGIVTTGSEVFHGRIADKFGPVVMQKFSELGSAILRQELVSDQADMTVKAIKSLINDGADLIAVTGGMSVDPDDRTPASIRRTGAEVAFYGAPVLPGAMFMLAYLGDIPIIGLPGCVMYHKTSIFDLLVPRILAGELLRREDIIGLGHGGLCTACETCRYPQCGFGK